MAVNPHSLDVVASGFQGWAVHTTKHFLVRKKERGVSMKDVRDTLEHPDMTYPSKEPDCIRFVRKCEGKQVHIIGLKLERARVLILKTVMVLPTGEVLKS